MEWYFRDISDDPSEKELTQQDQFNNTEVILAEALVRETIQNSTDARRSDNDPVRVRFALAEPGSPAARILLAIKEAFVYSNTRPNRSSSSAFH